MIENHREIFTALFPQFMRHWDIAVRYFTYKKFPEKKVLLREGERAKTLFLIISGCIRAYLIKENGKEVTTQFFFEGQMIASAESFITSTPSDLFIETIEETEVIMISNRNFIELMKHVDPMKEGLLGFMKDRLIYYMKLHTSYIMDSPEERYVRLVDEQPLIIERVPHHYIASFLGITAVSLSRIRGRLIRKGCINKS